MVMPQNLHSSLKKTPSRQTPPKSVRFADCMGESLAVIRYLTADDVALNENNGQQPKPSTSTDSDVRVRLCSFNSNGLLVAGTIQTVNPNYGDRTGEKVYVSLSTDNWQTVHNIEAFCIDSNSNNLTHRWCFSSYLKCIGHWRCFFKVVYKYNNDIIEDTNDNRYYCLQLALCQRSFDSIHDSIISDLLTLEQLLIY